MKKQILIGNTSDGGLLFYAGGGGADGVYELPDGEKIEVHLPSFLFRRQDIRPIEDNPDAKKAWDEINSLNRGAAEPKKKGRQIVGKTPKRKVKK
jgi:hypothetical protein